MTKKKTQWNADKWLSISAMLISFITLLIFIYQTNLLRKQNYLSILPYLMMSTTTIEEDAFYELKILNHGVGPAIIESVHLLYQGKRFDLVDFENSIHTFLVSQTPAFDSLKHWSSSTFDRGMAIPANTKYHILSVKGSPADYQLITQELDHLVEEGLDYEIIYRSIQGERWKINNQSLEPVRLP